MILNSVVRFIMAGLKMNLSRHTQRDPIWSQNLAVGHKEYVENIKTALGITVHYRSVVEDNGAYALKEPAVPYTAQLEGEKSVLSAENTGLLK